MGMAVERGGELRRYPTRGTRDHYRLPTAPKETKLARSEMKILEWRRIIRVDDPSRELKRDEGRGTWDVV